jgi:hypothetical protein
MNDPITKLFCIITEQKKGVGTLYTEKCNYSSVIKQTSSPFSAFHHSLYTTPHCQCFVHKNQSNMKTKLLLIKEGKEPSYQTLRDSLIKPYTDKKHPVEEIT